MDKSTYIGPYARCYDSKTGEPDNWAHELIIEQTGGERLYYANGESIDKPALFAPNVSYKGEPDFGDSVDEEGGQMEIQLMPVSSYTGAFYDAFKEEVAILEGYFNRVEIVFGVIVTWS